MASATITSSLLSPSVKTLRCNSISLAFKRDTQKEPNANPGTLAEVQTQGQENPLIVAQGVYLAGYGESTSILSLTDLWLLSKINYSGTNAPILKVAYGSPTQPMSLVGYAASSSINVILESFNFNIDMRDSKDGYRPSLSINFTETD